jgi:hypothetical protein
MKYGQPSDAVEYHRGMRLGKRMIGKPCAPIRHASMSALRAVREPSRRWPP